jgi:hypothetical protein
MLGGAVKKKTAANVAKTKMVNRKRPPGSQTGGERASQHRRDVDSLLNRLGAPDWKAMRERSAYQEKKTGFGMQWARSADGNAAATSWEIELSGL